MVFKLVETEDEPKELLETYRRKMSAYGKLVRAALLQADAPAEIADVMERQFVEIVLLLGSVIKEDDITSDKAIHLLEFALNLMSGTGFLTETAIINFKANKGYKLKGFIFKIQYDGLSDLIERLRDEPENS